MADSEQVLSQEQIDAMLGGGVVEQAVAEAPAEAPVSVAASNLEDVKAAKATAAAEEPAAAPPAPLAPPTAGPPPAAAGPGTGALQETIEQLTQRVAYLESILQGGAPANGAQLQELGSKVDSILVSLQGTVGYGARQTFVCSSCQANGNVAAKLNCTSCGEENWWGWWPPQQ